jgi:hypothetical protein
MGHSKYIAMTAYTKNTEISQITYAASQTPRETRTS